MDFDSRKIIDVFAHPRQITRKPKLGIEAVRVTDLLFYPKEITSITPTPLIPYTSLFYR